MAKRRSLNRRWSRRSANNSAYLNDDTTALEMDDNYWQHLNTSRPPSGIDISSATGVLDPDSNLMDSNMSTSQWNYLQKSSDSISQRVLSKSAKSPQPDVSIDPASSSDSSARVRKKRPLLRNTRNPKSKNALMNSSDSTVELNPPRPHSTSSEHSPSRVATRPTTPQETSLDSEKIQKKRPLFKRQTLKALEASVNSSVVLPSQETRKASIRATLLHKSPKGAPETPKDEDTSDADSQLISQPRKVFGQMRRIKTSQNPFQGILDETDEANRTAASPKETSNNEGKENDSGNFVLQVTPVDIDEQKSEPPRRSRRQDKMDSASSISEELKVSEESHFKSFEKSDGGDDLRSKEAERSKGQVATSDEDSDDYQSFARSNVSRSSAAVRGGRPGSRVSRSGRPSQNAANVDGPVQDDLSTSLQKRNETRESKASSSIQPRRSSGRKSAVIIEDASSAEELPMQTTRRSTRSLKSRSAQEDQVVNRPDESQEMNAETSRRSSRRSLKTSRASFKDLPVDTEETIRKKQSGPNQSTASRLSRPKAQVEENSDEELDVETASDEESLFSPKNTNISASQVQSPITPTVEGRTENGMVSRTPQREALFSKETPTRESFVRPGPRSSKLSIRPESSIRSSQAAGTMNESLTNSHLDKSGRLQSSQSRLSLSPPKQPFKQTQDPDLSGGEEIQRRPGPKSFKRSSRSLLSTSNTSRLSTTVPEASQVLTPIDDQAESLSESSSRIRSRRTDPSVYDLPAQERTPSVSLSEEDEPRVSAVSAGSRTPKPVGASVSLTPQRSARSVDPSAKKVEPSAKKVESSAKKVESSVRSETPKQSAKKVAPSARSKTPQQSARTETPQQSAKSKRRVIQTPEESPSPVKKLLKSHLPADLSSQNQSASIAGQTTDRTRGDSQASFDEPMPSTSSGAARINGTSVTDSTVEPTAEQKKRLRQLKIDALMKLNKTQTSQKPQKPAAPFNVEEFKKKLLESKRILEKRRAAEEEEERKRAEKKKQSPKTAKLTTGFKGLKKVTKPAKVVDRAFIVNGKVYKRPKLPRPKHWATNKLYKFLWKKLEPKFEERYRVKSEKFVVELSEVMTVIMRRKKYESYKAELDGLVRKMAELGIIETRYDFYGFCYDFLPFEFRFKVVPMLQAGNTHNIPFEPEKIMERILG